MTNINLQVLSGWRETLTVAFQKLRRISFVFEETLQETLSNIFSFGTFDPNTNFNGMTVSSYVLHRARYVRVFKILLFSIDFDATLAAPLTSFVTITVPGTTPVDDGSGRQGGHVRVSNAVAGEVGCWFISSNANSVLFFRTGSVNYTAISSRWTASGFIEVI